MASTYRKPTKLEREWLRVRSIAIKIHRTLDAGLITRGSDDEDMILDLLADVTERERKLQMRVTEQNHNRMSDFLCGRRKTNLQMDPHYYTVPHQPHERAIMQLLLRDARPICDVR